jgi:hypothetical protein
LVCISFILLAPNCQRAPEVVARYGNWEQIGIEHFICIMPNGYTIKPLNIAGEKSIAQATKM